MIMNSGFARRLAVVTALPLALAAPDTGRSAGSRQVQTVDGHTIDIGVLPATRSIPGAPAADAGRLHGGAPAWGEQYHVTIAVFDGATGQRMTDADINAAVLNATIPGKRVPGPKKALEPMRMAAGRLYGNYFNMPAPFPYRIEVDIRMNHTDVITKAAFEFRHAMVTPEPPDQVRKDRAPAEHPKHNMERRRS